MRWLVLFALLAGCAVAPTYRDENVPIASTTRFDADLYAGLWYEIARFPVPFQKGCVGVTAEYKVQPDGTLSVKNTCRQDTLDGQVRSIQGQAQVVSPGRLDVSFNGIPFSAPYWVLWVDADYRTAVVGTPNGRAGWILNRDPEISPDRLRAALEVLDFNGYDVSKLVRTPQ
ncbi:lipocalin family protein [Parasulfitobacter algicola]|uniref:Outer membrane lipoprotein Blc n=1 Tax=Parasulfitobacter algicola TaxID=2614809 RepID=A0ABX2IM28_9RHOB|nr:lipocalin family protein [Sulfitobacter algicola]NSX53922.1 lipocalin family protein [Sulfitobacter algicola]